MTLATLLLLRQCLHAQQLLVGDPAFRDSARSVLVALDELDEAIAAAEPGAGKAMPVAGSPDPLEPVMRIGGDG